MKEVPETEQSTRSLDAAYSLTINYTQLLQYTLVFEDRQVSNFAVTTMVFFVSLVAYGRQALVITQIWRLFAKTRFVGFQL